MGKKAATEIHQIADFTTKEARAELSAMLTQLFDHWGISTQDQAALLGLASGTRSTINRYRKGEPLGENRDLLDRASHLLGIHKSLRILFPQNRDLAYRWITTPNLRFSGQTPLAIMIDKGFIGIMMVRRYLDFERGR